jgi:hypothetical protein
MATVATPISKAATGFVPRFRPVIELTEEQFFAFCQLNQDLRIERTLKER